jgi:uncharacterized protein with von Willebrand factor type A (vWA) domain
MAPTHKRVFVGDATMSPYEIMAVGGSVEHWNEEPARPGSRACWRCSLTLCG